MSVLRWLQERVNDPRWIVGIVIAVYGVLGSFDDVRKLVGGTNRLLLLLGVTLVVVLLLRTFVVHVKRDRAATNLRLQLTAAQDRIAQLESQLTTTRARARESESRLKHYTMTLAELTRRYGHHEYEESVRIIFWIGKDDDSDRAEIRTRTTANDANPLSYRRLHVATSQAIKPIDFRTLDLMVEAPKGSVALLPPTEDQITAGRMEFSIFFYPPIGSASRLWHVSYRWPGAWKPLRIQGRDTASYVVTSANISHLEIVFAFPTNLAAGTLTTEAPGQIQEIDFGASRALSWTVDKPPIGRHSFVITANYFPRRNGRA